MFKLLKELTKPPEALAPPSTHGDPAQTHFAYAARHRARSASPSPSPVNGRSRSNTLEPVPPGTRRASDLRHSEGAEREEEEAIVETDEDAKRVVELLRPLKEARNEEGSGFMLLVEVCAEATCQSTGYSLVRIHHGLPMLTFTDFLPAQLNPGTCSLAKSISAAWRVWNSQRRVERRAGLQAKPGRRLGGGGPGGRSPATGGRETGI
jgi:hypothetical protein